MSAYRSSARPAEVLGAVGLLPQDGGHEHGSSVGQAAHQGLILFCGSHWSQAASQTHRARAAHPVLAAGFTHGDGTVIEGKDTERLLWRFWHTGCELGYLESERFIDALISLSTTGRAAALAALRLHLSAPQRAVRPALVRRRISEDLPRCCSRRACRRRANSSGVPARSWTSRRSFSRVTALS